MAITEQEAKDLFSKLVDLKSKYELSNSLSDKRQLSMHKNLIIEKLKYIVHSKTSSYKKFSNYEDLNQDGYEALIMGLNNFNPSKGSIFWWLHKYIDTRISRKANAHSVVKIPIKVAKNLPPKIEQLSFSNEDLKENQEESLLKKYEQKEIERKISSLSSEDKKIITMAYNDDKIIVNDFLKKNSLNKTQLNAKAKKIIKKIK